MSLTRSLHSLLADVKNLNGFSLFLLHLIRKGIMVLLFTPLVFYSQVVFPFVVPKALFFLIGVEVIFAAWLVLALSNRHYRPRCSAITITIVIFIGINSIAGLFGVNSLHSFWGTQERMSGVLFLIHSGALVIVLGSTIRSVKQWGVLFRTSLWVALIVTILFYIHRFGIAFIPINTLDGSSLGNPSFMSAYLLFHIFTGIWLISRTRSSIHKALLVGSGGFMTYAIYASDSIAVFVALIGGLMLLLIAWLVFRWGTLLSRVIAFFVFTACCLAGGIVIWAVATQHTQTLSHLPGIFSNQESVNSRRLVWGVAWRGIQERPLLGWGPENFSYVFSRHFNPALVLKENQRGFWFDRAHNLVLDVLVFTGVIGLISYLSLFGAALFLVWRQAFQKPSGIRDHWLLPSIITALLSSYFAQNLFLFDTPATSLQFALILSFVGAITTSQKHKKHALSDPHPLLVIGIFMLLLLSVYSYAIRPFLSAHLSYLMARPSEKFIEQLELLKRLDAQRLITDTQPLERFLDRVHNVLRDDVRVSQKFIADIDVIGQTIKKEHPGHLRYLLYLGRFYTAAGLHYPQYDAKAKKTLQEAMTISPTYPLGYQSLAAFYADRKEYEKAIELLEKAISLEPRHLKPHEDLVSVYLESGQTERARNEIHEIQRIDPRKELVDDTTLTELLKNFSAQE